jgi:hypothetical protein
MKAAAPRGHSSEGTAIVSMKTSPLNQSAGPRPVSVLLRVICMTVDLLSFSRRREEPRPYWRN